MGKSEQCIRLNCPRPWWAGGRDSLAEWLLSGWVIAEGSETLAAAGQTSLHARTPIAASLLELARHHLMPRSRNPRRCLLLMLSRKSWHCSTPAVCDRGGIGGRDCVAEVLLWVAAEWLSGC